MCRAAAGARRAAAADPPLLVRGDLADDLSALAAQAPAGATLVVFHTSVLYQVSAPRQERFAKLVRDLPGHWIANDTPDMVPCDTLPKPPDEAAYNLLALDGAPLAWTRSHGQAMTWFVSNALKFTLNGGEDSLLTVTAASRRRRGVGP